MYNLSARTVISLCIPGHEMSHRRKIRHFETHKGAPSYENHSSGTPFKIWILCVVQFIKDM